MIMTLRDFRDFTKDLPEDTIICIPSAYTSPVKMILHEVHALHTFTTEPIKERYRKVVNDVQLPGRSIVVALS
jgi:hypothetical protein